MTATGFASKLRAREPVAGVWTQIGHPVVAEVLADEFDFVVLDGEHSENDVSDLAALVRAVDAAAGDAAPVVRVSEANRAEIRRVLDFGPEGIVVPQIETVEEAREAVAAARYPPDGVRGVAGGRASEYGRNLEEYVDTANESVATIIQVETPSLVEDVDEVVEIDGLDALFVGPADLSARLGCFGEFDGDSFRRAIDRIVDAAAGTDVVVGTLATTLDTVDSRLDWGMDFLALGTDVGYLKRSAAEFTDAYDRTLRD